MSRRKPIQLSWGVRKEGRSLWTRNAVKGVSVRDERRKKDSRIEWRRRCRSTAGPWKCRRPVR